MNNSKLFVGNLSFTTTQNELQDMFAAHGTVTDASLINDRETGRARGFGFVTMSSPEEAQLAISALHGTDVGGRTLNINVAKPREERTGGSFGGGQRREFSGARNNRY
jgi:cold-inducible RNA-binding protein